MKIGVLALQGGFAEHAAALGCISGVDVWEIRKRADFGRELSGVIIPGGESTVMARLLADLRLLLPLREAVEAGLLVFGTCAGLILLARDVADFSLPGIGLLDVKVTRNAYGRQLESFRCQTEFADVGEVPMVFIRAPGIESVGSGVKALAQVDGQIVAVRQNNILATAFHPELTDDIRVHKYFVDMIAGKKEAGAAYADSESCAVV